MMLETENDEEGCRTLARTCDETGCEFKSWVLYSVRYPMFIEPTISLDSHQNIRLGAYWRTCKCCVTYLRLLGSL